MADTPERRRRLIEGVALNRGIELYEFYDTNQTAHFLKMSAHRLKTWRREGKKVPYPRWVGDRVKYLGEDICEALLGGTDTLTPAE